MSENYQEDEIQVLSSRDAVRKRPALYFEDCLAAKSLDKFPIEVLCHALDEFLDGNCRQITICLSDNSFTVEYDAGMSLETDRDGITRAELIMTAIFACRHQKKHLSVGEEFCELGMATINYVTAVSKLTTVSNGQKGQFFFQEGLLTEKNCNPVPEERDHTSIYMQPDPLIFGEALLTYAGVKERISSILDKLPGLNIILTNVDGCL
jgi:DNA gyrase/topoisomerase IV subunit B